MGLVFVLACVVGLGFNPVALLRNEEQNLSQDDGSKSDLSLASNYLQQFYSLQTHPTGRTKRNDRSFSSKLKEMQKFFNLQPTGTLSSETLGVMKTPRCGVPDVQEYVSSLGNRWNKNILSYRISRYTNDLPVETVDSLIRSALDVWEKASPLRFFRSPLQQADIMVDFAFKYHGDSYPFDGPKGTLAHAFDPGAGIGGDVHFDEDENWTADSKGFNLYQVAAHEFGHALGLRHSRNPDSLMYPTYKYRQTLLSSEDIRSISALYAPSATRPVYSSALSWLLSRWYSGLNRLRAPKDKCDPDLSFDSVTTAGKFVFFFKDRHVWMKKINQKDVKKGLIHDFMPKVSSRIDAAYWVPQRSTAYLFSGPHYWTMKDFRVKSRRKKISTFGFPAWVREIDAAVHLPKTGHTLFFTQDLYWRYDENQSSMERPRNISADFPGVEMPISAAAHSRGFLYFFVGANVFKFDEELKEIVSKSKVTSWLGC